LPIDNASKDIAWLPAFREFVKLFDVPSKEMVAPGKITLYQAQEIFLEQVTTGMAQGTRYFVILKARQLGISTILMILDIFWLLINPGTQGAFIADTADNKDAFRQTITQLLESLPKGYKVPIKTHNRNELVFANGSRLAYLSAGKGKNSGLGRSRALNFIHATEASSWGDQKGIDSLKAAMSETNPNRLYIFESTALGYNVFYDLYNEAIEAAPRQKAFFIGWWAKHTYSFKRGSPEYQKWWLGRPLLDEEEQFTADKVKSEFGYEITDEQWAWRREKAAVRNAASLAEEFPSYPEEAWQSTGNSFFPIQRIQDDLLMINQLKPTFSGYKYVLGENFLNMKMVESDDVDGLDLRIWEKPRDSAKYIIGCDPSYGRNAEADRHCISVWRCYSDKVVQVAEYATNIPDTRQCAWVLAHLAGVYRDCMINLEVSGPGMAIMQEFNSLKQLLSWGHLKRLASELKVQDCLDQARWYLYHRPDSMGAGYAYNWQTNANNKLMILNGLRDKYGTEQAVVRSVHLLDEMLTTVQDGDSIEASGRNKDDRVMAAAFAVHGWNEWIRVGMMAENRTWARENGRDEDVDTLGGEDKVLRHIIPSFLSMRAAERSDAQLKAMLEE
jgi:hypothetical protein